MIKFIQHIREHEARGVISARRGKELIFRRQAKEGFQECLLLCVVLLQVVVLAAIFGWTTIIDLVRTTTFVTAVICAGAVFGWVVLERVIFEWLVKEIGQRWNSTSILKPPGYGINSALKVIFPRKIHERVFEPIVAEMQRDYIDAVISGKPRLANWIRIRGVGLLCIAGLAQLPVSLLSLVVKLWKAAI